MDYEDAGSYELHLKLQTLEDIDPVMPPHLWSFMMSGSPYDLGGMLNMEMWRAMEAENKEKKCQR